MYTKHRLGWALKNKQKTVVKHLGSVQFGVGVWMRGMFWEKDEATDRAQYKEKTKKKKKQEEGSVVERQCQSTLKILLQMVVEKGETDVRWHDTPTPPPQLKGGDKMEGQDSQNLEA